MKAALKRWRDRQKERVRGACKSTVDNLFFAGLLVVQYGAYGLFTVTEWKPVQRAIDWHYRRNPPNWLLMANGHDWFHDMCASIGQSEQEGHPNEYVFNLSKDRKFTEPVQNAILHRAHPMFASQELFLKQLFDQVVAARPCYSHYMWHLGCDENGDLAVHQHDVHDNEDPVIRKRATIGMSRYGYRAKTFKLQVTDKYQPAQVADPF